MYKHTTNVKHRVTKVKIFIQWNTFQVINAGYEGGNYCKKKILNTLTRLL